MGLTAAMKTAPPRVDSLTKEGAAAERMRPARGARDAHVERAQKRRAPDA